MENTSLADKIISEFMSDAQALWDLPFLTHLFSSNELFPMKDTHIITYLDHILLTIIPNLSIFLFRD